MGAWNKHVAKSLSHGSNLCQMVYRQRLVVHPEGPVSKMIIFLLVVLLRSQFYEYSREEGIFLGRDLVSLNPNEQKAMHQHPSNSCSYQYYH